MKTEVASSGRVTLTAGKTLTIKMMLAAVYSFLICRCVLLGSISSFGVSFCAAMPAEYAWIAVLGGILGYGTQGLAAQTICPVLTLTIVTLIRMIVQRVRSKEPAALPAVLSGTVLFLSNLAVHVVGGFALPDLILRLCEAILTGGVAYLGRLALTAFFDRKNLTAYTSAERTGLAMLGLLAITALMNVSLSFFQFGVLAASTVICLIASRLGSFSAALGAIFVSIAINLYATDYLILSAILIVGGLTAGIFHSFGRFPVAAVFLLTSIFLSVIFGITLPLLYQLVGVLTGCALFLGIPAEWADAAFPRTHRREEDFSLKDHAERRILFAASTVDELQNLICSITERLAQITPEDNILTLYQDTVQSVCMGCSNRSSCWQEHYAETASGFLAMTEALKNGHRPGTETLEETSLANCIQKSKLTDTISTRYHKLLLHEHQKRQSTQMRELAVEQLTGISDMLRSIGEELDSLVEPDNRAALLVRDLFTALAAPPICCFASVNEFDRMELDIYCSAAVQFDEESLQEEFSRVLRRTFARPIVSQAQNNVRISFFEEAAFSPQICCRQAAGVDADNVCGDTCTHFSDSRGNLYLLLSDGMGTGREAAVDSSLTCSMIVKLIKAGFGMDSVLKFVNSTLQANRLKETLSTIDIAKIDLYTGRVEFFKAGSASSFVSLDGIVAEVSSHSLPVGILQGIQFDRRIAILNDGDLLLMMSDGVLTPDPDTIKHYIEAHQEESISDLADGLIAFAKTNAEDGRFDDLSVLAIRLDRTH